MAYADEGKCDVSFVAAADLSAKQYHFVKLNSAGKVAIASAAGEVVLGVLQNKPGNGEAATVRILGVSKVSADAALDEGDLIKTSADGQAAVAAKATTDTSDTGAASDALVGSYVVGQCVAPASAAGKIGSVLLLPVGAVATTAA